MSQFNPIRKASSSSSDNGEDEDSKDPEEPEMGDGDEINPVVQLNDSAMDDEAAVKMNADNSLPQLIQEQTSANFHCSRYVLLDMIFWLPTEQLLDSKCIFSSLTIHPDLELQCKAVKVKPLLMICDVSTHWNSTALMLGQALQLQKALKLLVIMEQHNHTQGAQLAQFKILR
jgi:hypothetical protein